MTHSIALLLDNESMQRWQFQTVDTAIKSCDISIDLVVIQKNRPDNSGKKGIGLDDFTPWNLYRAYHRRIASTPNFRESIPLDNIAFISDADVRYSEAIDRDGLGNELPEGEIDALSTADVAVRFGFGILMGEALQAPKHGVIGFHHGDLTEYRGRPAGFWEFVNQNQKAGVTLQRLTESLDGGEIIEIKEIDISDAVSWLETQELLFNASDDMLATAFAQLTADGFETTSPDELGTLYKNPGFTGLFRYLYNLMGIKYF